MAATDTTADRQQFQADREDLTEFQKRILVILNGADRYGLAIKRELQSYYGEDVNHGRLYPNLDTLVNKGLVEKTERDARTNNYELTSDGLTWLEQERQWEDQYLVGIDA